MTNRPTSAAAGRHGPRRAAALLVAAVLPLLFGADQSFEERHERVRRMTTTERAALQYNFETFQKLAPADKERYRKLDSELAIDKEKNRGQLNAVMARYVEWLGTLNSVQRAELRATTDPTAKLDLVRRFRDLQERDKSSPPIAIPGFIAGRGTGFLDRFRPAPATFQSMMEIIENRLPPGDKKRDLQQLDPPRRHVRTLEEMIRLANNQKIKFPTDDLVLRLIDVVKDENFREKLSEMRQPGQRGVVSMALIAGLYNEWSHELNQRKPDDRALQAFFAQLPEQEQKRLSDLPDDGMRRFQLFKLYFAKSNPELARDLQLVESVSKELRPEPMRGDGRPGDRPGGRPLPGPQRGPLRGPGGKQGGERPNDGPGGPPPQRP